MSDKHAKTRRVERIRSLVFTLTLCCTAVSPASAQPSEEVRQIAEPILNDPNYILLPKERISWRENAYGHILLPEETSDHVEGIYQLIHATISAAVGSPSIYSYGQSRVRVLDAERKYFSENECRARALEFLKRQFHWFFKMGNPTLNNAQQPEWKSQELRAVWKFDWQQLDAEGLAIAEASASVRTIDGKIVGFSVRKEEVSPHKFKLSQAKQVAMNLASQNKTVKNVSVGGIVVFKRDAVTGNSKLPPLLYRLNLTAIDIATGRTVLSYLLLDADTGKPVWIDFNTAEPTAGDIRWRMAHGRDAPTCAVYNVDPICTRQGVAAISSIILAGIPNWGPTVAQVVLHDAAGRLSHLTQDLISVPDTLYGLLTSSWFALERQGWCYALNTQTGDYHVLGTPSRPAMTPGISPDGQWAVVAGTSHGSQDDSDLFVDHMGARGPVLQLRARLVLPGSDEHHPVFSPDNQWLFFVSSKTVAGKTVHTLCRLPAALVHTLVLTRLQTKQVETIIPVLPGAVVRLSIYPGGTKLLLQTDKGLVMVDARARTAVLVALPVLHDAEIGGVIINGVQDGWAGPKENEVTFSGQTTDAHKVMRRRIYSCKLDGSSLRSWTPKESEPVPAYKFPEGQKTSFDLAKEWALSEIKSEGNQER